MSMFATLWTALSLQAGIHQTWAGPQGADLMQQTKAVGVVIMPLDKDWALVSVMSYGLEKKDRGYTVGMSFKLK